MSPRLPLSRRPPAEPTRLRLDPVACDGVGMCAHLASQLVRLDPWGFPLLTGGTLAPGERRAAKRAVSGCPRRALFLDGRAPS